jgi:hypothetical protein
MRARWVVMCCLVISAPGSLPAAEPVTASNWKTHPAIVEIERIYQETRSGEDTGRLRKRRRVFEYCQSYEDIERTLHMDARGAVRSYHSSGGSEDSAVELALYYDRSRN